VAEERRRMALITGIAGQDGSYLAEHLIAQGYQVVGTSHRSDSASYIKISGVEIPLMHLDLGDTSQIRSVLEKTMPAEVYNLAARSSSSQLFDDPIATAEINGLAVVRFLEAIHQISPATRFCQASSSEVFAKTSQSQQDETTPLHPRNAYGAAKVFAQNMAEAYRERHGLFVCSAILFNHESPRRGHEYVTRKVTRAAARIAAGLDDSLKLGNVESRRDWGFAGDYVRAMWLMLQQSMPEDFVIASGETHSVRELCQLAFSRVGLDYRDHLIVEPGLVRGGDNVELCGNPKKAMTQLGWRPSMSFEELVSMMVDADCAALAREAV
jgi:GDPmannose 4,6-dehydratase